MTPEREERIESKLDNMDVKLDDFIVSSTKIQVSHSHRIGAIEKERMETKSSRKSWFKAGIVMVCSSVLAVVGTLIVAAL